MKLPSRIRHLGRTAIGLRKAPSLTPDGLHALAAREPVVVVGVGVLGAGATDARLPGEQRTASLATVVAALADVPRDRVIVTHCG